MFEVHVTDDYFLRDDDLYLVAHDTSANLVSASSSLLWWVSLGLLSIAAAIMVVFVGEASANKLKHGST